MMRTHWEREGRGAASRAEGEAAMTRRANLKLIPSGTLIAGLPRAAGAPPPAVANRGAISAASAGAVEVHSGHPGTDRGKVARVPATAVLDWNAVAVATVRAAVPTKFQIESDLYVAYVQASVYDAVVKIAGRYEPYHDFVSPVSPRGASVPAAVAAAAYTALAYYFPAQQTTLQTTYTAYLAGLGGDG